MGRGHRVKAALAALLAACAVAAGCKRPAPDPLTTSAPGASPSANVLPADHLAPGELVDGPDHALGVPLPQGVRVTGSVGKTVYAGGDVPLHSAVEYLRKRLANGSLREGESSATFEDVTAPGTSAPPLRVNLTRVRDATRIVIDDTTPPPPPPALPDEAARWKRVGLTPAGRLADPTHLD